MQQRFSAKQRALVDEYGSVQSKLAAFSSTTKPLKDREKELRAELLKIVEKEPPDQAFALDGDHYTVTLSECRMERTIRSMKRVFVVLGQKLFLASCTFPLKALSSLLLPDEVAKLVDETATGAREVIATPRVEIAKARRKAA
jgi:hypothetical protein